MITLIRWYKMKIKALKWKLAFYQFCEKQLAALIANPEEIEKKLLPYLADLIHSAAQEE